MNVRWGLRRCILVIKYETEERSNRNPRAQVTAAHGTGIRRVAIGVMAGMVFSFNQMGRMGMASSE
jgi:hypothetical protein